MTKQETPRVVLQAPVFRVLLFGLVVNSVTFYCPSGHREPLRAIDSVVVEAEQQRKSFGMGPIQSASMAATTSGVLQKAERLIVKLDESCGTWLPPLLLLLRGRRRLLVRQLLQHTTTTTTTSATCY